MLKSQLPEKQKDLTVPPQEKAIVLAEDSDEPLSLILPPTDDMAEFAALRPRLVSLKEQAEERRQAIELDFRQALEHEKRKQERFSTSPTYFNRLATLAAAAGDFKQESLYVAQAAALSSDAFFQHRQGDNLIANQRLDAAEHFYEVLAAAEDLDACLKLAAIHVRNRSFDAAARRIQSALELDPSSYAARLFEGGLRLARGDPQGAIHSFRLAADERPSSSVLFSNFGIAYLRAGEHEKAISALKRSIALDPLNANSIFVLADVCFEQNRDDEAIPSLTFFLAFEQKQAAGWARLARACMKVGQVNEALAALKREASLNESSAVWNNLGVAYTRLDDPDRAIKGFKRAMELAQDRLDRDYFLAARNVAQFLASQTEGKTLLKFTESVLAADFNHLCLTTDPFTDLYAFHFHGLRKSNEAARLTAECETILSQESASAALRAWIVAGLISFHAFQFDNDKALAEVIDSHQRMVRAIRDALPDHYRSYMFFNNIAFAYAELNRLSEAEEWLSYVGKLLHKEPYTTATLGLIDIRKGHIDKGTQRYLEAISLASRRSDKQRIRQKFNFELAKYWSLKDESKSRRLLEKVISISDGEEQMRLQAKKALTTGRMQ